ncbi:porin [Synechococcus sp. RSCCF101]|uniref:iron uptake porin n=1 Tax=Synechococcus sp. RSCCF101 TaxID=2511069 RepID=UPI0012487609|nr:iron uptake porin [Synechococcus sp. RSCCF101]QEY32212.1 porin [Synechococcus sp. RSCCF101]
MKCFPRLLVAPVLLGLAAPAVLPPAGAQATELNLDDVSAYAVDEEAESVDPFDQVTSISQFSDVYPTDWAYQALSNLIERYGCVAGYPDGTYRGGRAMTRFEAAALLNACLDRITEVTDELKRLMKEFEKELAILRGRVDGLEARVGELEATQFSTTTKLSGKAEMVLGGTSYTGDYDYNDLDDPQEATSFIYRTTLNLNTSFTSKDLLYTRLRSGNAQDSAFSGKGYVPLALLDSANNNDNTVKLDKLWYQFPAGDFTFYVAPRAENYYFLSSQPTIYNQGRFILKLFKWRGADGVYGHSSGAGGGFNWKKRGGDPMQPRLGISASYIAREAEDGNPNTGGIGTDNAEGKFVAQVAYGNPQWQISAGYAYTQQAMTLGLGTTDGGAGVPAGADANSLAVNGYWQPLRSSWIPAVSVGYGVTWLNLDGDAPDGTRSQSMSWMAGLEWKDAFAERNRLGFGIAGPQWVTEQKGGDTPDDGNMAFELWYEFRVTDNIAVTPALFYLSRPFGQETGSSAETGGVGTDSFGTLGYLVRTTFRF